MYVDKDDDDDSHSRKDDESTECYSSDSHFNAVGGSTASAHQSSSRTFNCDEGKLMSNVTAANEAHTHHQSYPDVRVDSTRVRSAKCNCILLCIFVVLVLVVLLGCLPPCTHATPSLQLTFPL